MKFNEYEKIYEALTQEALQAVLQKTLRPELVAQVMAILNANSQSPLVQFILGRAIDPTKNPPQQFVKRQVGTVQAYKLDPNVYKLLMEVKAGDVGPGEVLIALIGGTWKGGTGGDYDVMLPNVGQVEIKYLGPFAHSTNVPMGSAEAKRIVDTDFAKVIEEVGKLIKANPNVLKGRLQPAEINYFLSETIDQIFIWDENISTNSLRLIGRLLRNSEKSGAKDFSSKGITFARFTKAMEDALKSAVGSAPFIMFLGEKIERSDDPMVPSTVHDGQYYIMPKEDMRYYMFYRIYKNERIKIAPFATEKEFFEKTVH